MSQGGSEILGDGRWRAPGSRVTWLVVICYAVLTWTFWGAFVLDRGLHADTIYIELSQTRPGWAGFLYPYDSTRIFMSLPFHLAYWLSDGSYLSLNVVFGALVFLTGFLVYALLKTLLPRAELLCFIAGAIALTLGADRFGNLVSINMVRQAVVCTLLAMLLFRIAWQRGWWLLFIPIAAAQVISLWSYEAGLPIMLLGPLLILGSGAPWRRIAVWSGGWLLVPSISIGLIFYRYLISDGASYQSASIAREWSVGEIVTRLFGFINQGVGFWNWAPGWESTYKDCVGEIRDISALPLIIGVVAFAVCARLIVYEEREDVPAAWPRVLLGGLLFIVAGYAAFLALAPDRVAPAWRTQFFAAAPVGLLWATAIVIADRVLRGRGLIAVAIATFVVGAGLYAGLLGQLEQNARWAPYRKTMAAIVAAAPNVKDGTMIVLVGTPSTPFSSICPTPAVPNPPFEDNLWFNSGLKVLYPKTKIVGVFWDDKMRERGAIFYRFDENGARIEREAVTVDGKYFGFDQMIAFAYDRNSGAVLLPKFPTDKVPGTAHAAAYDYDPLDRILKGPAPAAALRKLAR
jgi:hypothetical protein